MVRYAQKPDSEKEKKVTFISKEPIVCPVCEASFNREELFSGRVNAGDLTDELHRTYIPMHSYGEVHPLVYELTVCPSCWYSAYKYDFLGLPSKVAWPSRTRPPRASRRCSASSTAPTSIPEASLGGRGLLLPLHALLRRAAQGVLPRDQAGPIGLAVRLALRLPRQEESRRELRLRGQDIPRQGALSLSARPSSSSKRARNSLRRSNGWGRIRTRTTASRASFTCPPSSSSSTASARTRPSVRRSWASPSEP